MVQSNSFGARGVQLLSEALAINQSIKSVNLAYVSAVFVWSPVCSSTRIRSNNNLYPVHEVTDPLQL
jgi:hypothetical protein